MHLCEEHDDCPSPTQICLLRYSPSTIFDLNGLQLVTTRFVQLVCCTSIYVVFLVSFRIGLMDRAVVLVRWIFSLLGYPCP